MTEYWGDRPARDREGTMKTLVSARARHPCHGALCDGASRRRSRSRTERLERHGKRRHAGFDGFLLQRRDLVGTVGNAAPASLVFVAALRLAGHENLVEALRGGAGADALDQRVHALAIVLFRHEQIG